MDYKIDPCKVCGSSNLFITQGDKRYICCSDCGTVQKLLDDDDERWVEFFEDFIKPKIIDDPVISERMLNILEQSLEKLEECPFCGDKAEIFEDEPQQFYVACTNLDCQCEAYLPFAKTKQEAINSWNRRVNQ
jgi:Lar family restriction alleviation protein